MCMECTTDKRQIRENTSNGAENQTAKITEKLDETEIRTTKIACIPTYF